MNVHRNCLGPCDNVGFGFSGPGAGPEILHLYVTSFQKAGRVSSLMCKEEKASPGVRQLQEGVEAQDTTEGKGELIWIRSCGGSCEPRS